jgi:hypothetical protein
MPLKQLFNLRALSLLLTTLLLASCTSTQTDWPTEAAERAFFIRAYSDDERNQQFQSRNEYLGWVRNFYTGTLVYPTGWLDIQSQLLNGAKDDEQSELRDQLNELGAVIGAEWAKENELRLINNRMLAVWGSVLQLADLEGKREESIDVIALDVEGLLQGRVDNQDIVESRYSRLLGLEFFGGF